jgi:DNA-binding CsgD family transcriptional regulator
MLYKGFDGRLERQKRHRDRSNDALTERESEQLKLLMERDRYRETI